MNPELPRLRAHFTDVVHELRARDTRALSPAARGTRAHLIDALDDYAARGEFPKNRDFPGLPVPYFVDTGGVRCAVGHLMHLSGEDALVTGIAASHNNAYIAELADNPRLRAWLERVGLDAAEAARIQPGYCFIEVVSCVCQLAAPTLVSATVDNTIADRVEARVTEVFGAATGASIGDRLTVYWPFALGDKLLIPIFEEGSAIPGRVLEDRVEFICGFGDGLPRLLTADVIAAWLAVDCAATLTNRDPDATQSICDYQPNGRNPEPVDNDSPDRDSPTEATEGDLGSGTVVSGDGCSSGPAHVLAALAGLGALTFARRRREASGL